MYTSELDSNVMDTICVCMSKNLDEAELNSIEHADSKTEETLQQWWIEYVK